MSTQPAVPTFEEGSIADTASRARQLLICCQESTTEEPQRLALTQLARFNLWASNIGVFASQHASLDYRLRTALSVRAAVEGNLEIICKHLLTILKASLELSEEEFDALFDTPQSQVSVFAKSLFSKSMSNDHMRVKAFNLVETKITLLHQLSLAIRRASNRDNLARIPKLFDIDTEYVIIRGQREDGCNSETSIESVRFDIGAEFEEYVQKVLTHRWLRHPNDEEDLDKEQHNYRQTLLERCISAVSTRRRQLNYFRAHQNRLENNGKKLFRPPGQQSIKRDALQTGIYPGEKDPRSGLLEEPRLDQPSEIAYEPSNFTHDKTIVSDFNLVDFKPPPASSAPSSSASTTASDGFRVDGPFEVPQPPKLDSDEKEKQCPYCYLVLPIKTFSTVKKAKGWGRHLLEDLQPYVCIYTNCTTPGKTYSSFGAWKSHLSQPHYHSWQCSLHLKDDKSNDTNDESVVFNTWVEFKRHLKIFHSDCDSMSANDPSQHVHQLAALPQWCFVCFETLPEPVVLLKHMTNHFKSMSLLALPWRDDIADDEAMASDKIVISDVTDAQDDAPDTDLTGIAFGGRVEAGEIVTETTRASDVQGFASLLSVVKENPVTYRDRLQSFENWAEKLKSVSEMLEPEQETARPLTPKNQAILDDPSNDQSFEQEADRGHPSSSGKPTARGEMLTSSSVDKQAIETQIYLKDGNGLTQHNVPGGTGHQYSKLDLHIYRDPGMTINIDAATHTFEDSRDEIIQALHTSPYRQRKDRNPDRVTGTCEWFLNHIDYHNWRDSTSSSMLWVSANPGCGKSVLAKCLVDELKTTRERTACYFFFKDDFEDQRSAKSALSCILHQLFTQREDLFSAEIMRRFTSYKTPAANLYYELWELWDILIMASKETNAGEIICILDAFDECENRDRQDLAKVVREFYVQNSNTKQSVNLKFLITSRPYDKIRRDLVPFNLEDVPVIHLKGDRDKEVEKIAREIDLFIKDRVSRVRQHFGLTEQEEDLLLQGLLAVPNQTYLWAYLTLDWIETEIHEISETKIRNAISILPRTVDEAYDKILSKSTDVAETKKLLHIVVSAERPLTLEEMDLALTLGPHHKSYKDLQQRPSDRFRKYIRDLCGLFINIRDEKIYLLHQTAKEFLVPRGHQESQEGVMPQQAGDSQTYHRSQLKWRHSLIPSHSHRILFEVCVWYLLLSELDTRDVPMPSNIARSPHHKIFLEYSAKYWAKHFHASDAKEDEFRKQLWQICDFRSERCLNWFRVYWADVHTDVEFPRRFPTLMVASYFGIETIVRLQLQSSGVDLDAIDDIFGRSALSWASGHGFEGVVNLLINGPKFNLTNLLRNNFRSSRFKGATVDTRDKEKRTPLSYASLNGHLSVVRILVKAGARADIKDLIGGTPLSYALCTGRQDIANELTTRAHEVSINDIRDVLLLSAVQNGHQLIVKRLLDSGADIEAANKDNETPLVIAARYKKSNLAQLLIERGANIKAVSKFNETPLRIATRNGNTALVQFLIERGADIEQR